MEMNEMRDIAKFFFDEKITVHVDTFNNSWYNGLIIELHETMIVINDRVEGELPIPFSKIKTLEKFREVKK